MYPGRMKNFRPTILTIVSGAAFLGLALFALVNWGRLEAVYIAGFLVVPAFLVFLKYLLFDIGITALAYRSGSFDALKAYRVSTNFAAVLGVLVVAGGFLFMPGLGEELTGPAKFLADRNLPVLSLFFVPMAIVLIVLGRLIAPAGQIRTLFLTAGASLLVATGVSTYISVTAPKPDWQIAEEMEERALSRNVVIPPSQTRVRTPAYQRDAYTCKRQASDGSMVCRNQDGERASPKMQAILEHRLSSK